MKQTRDNRNGRLIAGSIGAMVVALSTAAAAPPGGGGNGNGNGNGGNGGGGGGSGEPANPVIAYMAGGHLKVMDADGSNATRVLAKAGSTYTRPAWSPDGLRIAFNNGSGTGGDDPGLYAIDLDGGGLTMITTLEFDGGADWAFAPAGDDHDKIVFSDAAPAGGLDLYIVNADGTGRFNLTQRPGHYEVDPSWSPAGDRVAAIVWDWEQDDPSDLVVFDLVWVDGVAVIAGEVNLTDAAGHPLNGAELFEIEWSNGGDRLAVSAELPPEGQRDLWIVDLADPGAPVRLTQTPDVWERCPAWSPDDAQIAYGHDVAGTNDAIKVIPAAGGAAVTLVSGKLVGSPDWW